MTYAIKCDECKTEIGRTESIRESAAGGCCEACRPAETTQILGLAVEKVPGDDGAGARIAYVLSGPRGARYELIRCTRNPRLLFAWNARTHRVTSARGYTWFTDTAGKLEVYA